MAYKAIQEGAHGVDMGRNIFHAAAVGHVVIENSGIIGHTDTLCRRGGRGNAGADSPLDVPAAQEGFYVKGNAHCAWGMKNRLARMFRPQSGNTVMLAFDHGCIM